MLKMNTRYNRLAWGAAAVIALAAATWRLVPLSDAEARIAPLAAGPGQRMETLPLKPWEVDFFGEARVRRWLSQGGGPAVIATVVDGSRNRRVVHDPAFCFRGAGWTVAADEPLALSNGEARRVILRREGSEMEAVYWFSDGRRAFGSPTHYWLETTWRRLTLGASGPEPVLVLLVPAQGRAPNWTEWLAHWPQFTLL
jgi:hypothetical protein